MGAGLRYGPKIHRNTRVMKLLDQLILGLVTRWTWRRYPELVAAFVKRNGHPPCTAFPRTANEKFLWRKIFDHDPRFTILSDKLASKAWVAERVPSLAIPEILWRGTDPRTIPESVLHQNVVFKANHSWRTNHFIRDGNFNREEMNKLGQDWLAKTHGLEALQWGYFNIPRELFIEREIEPGPNGLEELKVYTFGDQITRVVHIGGRFDAIWANVWKPDQNGVLKRSPTPATVAPPDPSRPLPQEIDEATRVARVLGQEFDHLRIDLLWDSTRLWFGELTVYNLSGYFPGHSGTNPDSETNKAWDIRLSAFLCNPPRHVWRSIYARSLARVLQREEGPQLPRLLAHMIKSAQPVRAPQAK